MEPEVEETLASVETANDALPVDLNSIALILEALLLAADGPLSIEQLVKLVGTEFNLGKRELRDALSLMADRHADTASELIEVASGFRLQVRPQYSEWISRIWQEKPPKYSRALLETLALIIYRQPITRGEIEDVRGVAVSSNILRTLLDRGWIRELGYKEVPGRPALFGSTAQFMDDFNIKSLNQLPALPDIKDLEQLEAALSRLGAGALPSPVDDDADDDEMPEPASQTETLAHDAAGEELADEVTAIPDQHSAGESHDPESDEPDTRAP